MKVLVTATTFPRWKNDTEPPFVYLLCKYLSNVGHQMIIVAPHSHKAKFNETMDGMKIYRYPYFFPFSLQRLCYDGGILPNMKKSLLAKVQAPMLLVAEFFFLLFILNREKPRILHAHWIVPQGIVTTILKKFYPISVVLTGHGGDVFAFQKGALKKLFNFAVKGADILTVNSSATQKLVEATHPKARVVTIPMGVDTEVFNSNKKDIHLKKTHNIPGPFLLTVGRLVEKKGIKYLIQAMQSVKGEFPNAKLLIIGDGPERKHLEDLSTELNLKKNISFVGKISHEKLPAFYATADVFISPSIEIKSGDTEGLGVVLLEALASETVAIGTNIGGIPDFIIPDKTGFLVAPQDEKDLAKKNYFHFKK